MGRTLYEREYIRGMLKLESWHSRKPYRDRVRKEQDNRDILRWAYRTAKERLMRHNIANAKEISIG